MKIFIKKLFHSLQLITFFILSTVPITVFASDLDNAQKAFEKKDYSTALTQYQAALKNHSAHENQTFSDKPSAIQNPSLTQKIASFFKGESKQPQTNPNSKNIVEGYIHLQKGKCYVQLNQIDQAVSEFDKGVTAGGDNDMGNACLFEKGYCHMKQKDFQNAYQSMKEYVKRNIDKDPKDTDPEKLKRASYAALVCAWKLNKSGVAFESDMEGAKALAKKGSLFLSSSEKRLYFKK